MHHPAGQFAGQARPPADADLGAAAAPVIAVTPGAGPISGLPSGGWLIAPCTFALDAQFGEDRHAVHEAFFQPRHDPVVIGVEQFVFRLPRAMVFPDGVGVLLLVDADQAAISAPCGCSPRPSLVVADHRQFAVEIAANSGTGSVTK